MKRIVISIIMRAWPILSPLALTLLIIGCADMTRLDAVPSDKAIRVA